MSSALHGVHVALAGHGGDAREFLAQTLRYHGALVTVHDAARSLTRLMAVLQVNVLVLDLDEVSDPSVKLLRTVRGLSPHHGRRLPIVVLFSGPANAEPQLLAEDVDAVVRKPVRAAELARVIAAAAGPDHERGM
jgi:CheY-like chemotaxis protein